VVIGRQPNPSVLMSSQRPTANDQRPPTTDCISVDQVIPNSDFSYPDFLYAFMLIGRLSDP
jgi:hypothetical protein